MREVVFTVEYEKGVGEVMDLFIEHPDLHARSMEVHATSKGIYSRVEVVLVLDAFGSHMQTLGNAVDNNRPFRSGFSQAGADAISSIGSDRLRTLAASWPEEIFDERHRKHRIVVMLAS